MGTPRHATDISPSKFHRKIKMNLNIAIMRLFLIGVALSATWALPIADERITGSDLLRAFLPEEPPSETLFLEKVDEVEYVGNTINGNQWIKAGECSSAQQGRINAGIDAAMPGIQKGSSFSSHSDLVTKWYGSPTSIEPDADVKKRYDDAIAKLSKKDWTNHCCPSSGSDKGTPCYQSCGHSGEGRTTLAFVTSYKKSGDKEYQYNGVMWCARAFSEMSDKQLGYVAFHEAIHMVSRAGDGASDYSKAAIVQQAKSSPNTARTTAQSFTLYAMQAGETYKEYEKLSASWGGSMSDDGSCKDRYSNCVEMASTQNCNSNNNALRSNDNCCHACSKLQPPGTTFCGDDYGNCNSLASSASACKTGQLSNGASIGIACCKSCKANHGIAPDDQQQDTPAPVPPTSSHRHHSHSPHSHTPHSHTPHSHTPHSHTPTSSCADGDPKITLNGAAATCPQLMGYCDHGSLGATMLKNCPSTCGSHGCPKICQDNPNGPGFTGWTCDAIKAYCNHGTHGPTITKNCPKTCGACS